MKKMPNKLKKLRKASDVHKALHENPATDAVLRKLRSYLDTAEPDLVYFLVNLWNNQGRAITYKELREAILAGTINEAWIEEWRQDYSRFIVKHLKPKWIEAMRAAAAEKEAKFPEWYFKHSTQAIEEWTGAHAAELVTNCTQTQIEGLRAVIQQAATMEVMSVDRLARAIRPIVGLTRPMAIANLKYYNTLIDNGLKQEKALDLAARYGARQHRYRGYLIARAELAKAYNKGAEEATRQAIKAGYLPRMVKVGSCALDERVCSRCSSLDGKVFEMDDNTVEYPLHPGCRCTFEYRERKDVKEKKD